MPASGPLNQWKELTEGACQPAKRLRRSVARAAIGHDHLDVAIVLPGDAVEAAQEQGPGVEASHDDGDAHGGYIYMFANQER